MDIEHIKSFITLCETLNFTKAAEIENITQTAMTRRISSIENELGILLLNRNNKKVTLTPAGKSFFENSKTLVNLYNNSVISVKNVDKGFNKQINLGVGLYEIYLLDNLLPIFSNKYKKITTKVLQYNYRELLKRLNSLELDIIFTTDQFLNSASLEKYDYILLSDKPWNALINKKNILSNEDILNLSNLKDENLITMFSSSIYTINDFYKEFFDVNNVTYVNTFLTKLSMIKANLGIGFIPSYLKFDTNSIITKETNPKLHLRNTYALKHKNNNNYFVNEFWNLISSNSIEPTYFK